MIIPQLLHQVDAAAVRQTNVADQNIELFTRGRFQGGLDAVGGLNVITAPPQKLSERAVRILVVFDEKNAHRLVRSGSGGSGALVRSLRCLSQRKNGGES